MRSTRGPEIEGSIIASSGSRGLERSPTKRFARIDFAASRALHNGCGDRFVIPGHDDPGHDVGDEADAAAAQRHDEPQNAHQRHVHAEVTRKTGANAGNLLVVHGAAQPAWRSYARHRRNPRRLATARAKRRTFIHLETTPCAEHNFPPSSICYAKCS